MGAPRRYRLAVLSSHPIQYFAPLYRRLAQEPDIDATVYFCSAQGANEYLDEGFGVRLEWDTPLLDGYHYRRLPNLRRGNSVAGFFSLINPRIVTELRSGGYDALWVHGHAYATFLAATLVARLLRIPVLMRSETHLRLRRSPLKRALRSVAMTAFYRHLCAACLPIGTNNREFYRFHGVTDDRLFTVPYTVDNDFFSRSVDGHRKDTAALASHFQIPLDRPRILFASKLIPRKRPLDLLLAYEKVRNAGTDCCLLLVGAGEQEALLRRYVTAHHVPDVSFLGFRNQSELPKFYALADVFVLPSENEPWGLIVNEAMAAALPVVVTEDVGAAADLVGHGDNGLVYSTGDVAALAAHLTTLVNDPALRRRMGARSLARIGDWDLDRSVKGLREALAAVCRSPHRELSRELDAPRMRRS
jgi:glycosyltransferase involved in cell wall biosynthesis